MAKVKYYAKENSTIGTHSFYAVPIPKRARVIVGGINNNIGESGKCRLLSLFYQTY